MDRGDYGLMRGCWGYQVKWLEFRGIEELMG